MTAAQKYKTMYCKKCGWEHEDKVGYAMVNACGNCGRGGLCFITFYEHEREAARAFLDREHSHFAGMSPEKRKEIGI